MPGSRSVELIRHHGGGYGFTVSGQNPCFIGWVANGSSAETMGLKRNSGIIRVNGENVSCASHEHVVKLIGLSDDLLQLEVQDGTSTRYSSSDDDDDDMQYRAFNELHSKGTIHHKPLHLSQSRVQKETAIVFSRTKHVLNELKNGTLFQALPYSLDSAPFEAAQDVNSSAASGQSGRSSRVKPRQKRQSRDRRKPVHGRNSSLPMQACNKDNYNINSNKVFVQSVVAYLGTVEIAIELRENTPNVCYTAMEACVHRLRREQHIHQRVLLKVTQRAVKLVSADGDVIAVYDGRQICFSSSCPEDDRFFCIATLNIDEEVHCHQFMVDPDISAHRNHVEKAKRFGIHCSMETETSNCIEFPQSARIILKMIESLFDPQQMRLNLAPMSMVQIHPNHTEDLTAANPTTDGNLDVLDGSEISIQSNSHQSVTTTETGGRKLNQQNLKEHDRYTLVEAVTQDGNFNRYVTGTGVPPVGMNAILSGKYKGGAVTLPLQRSSASRNSSQESRSQEIRLSKREKKSSKTGEGLFFRVPKRSSSRQLKLNMKNIMSKSSENIPLSETGQLSGASSIESLNSNASLPSYFNGVGPGILNTENGVYAWGLSFDKMLEDPVGVKYFTEFLRKEFSQENILFWLECEKLRKMHSTDRAALKDLADSIYERFLSGVATSPVNIDSKGQRLSEEALTKPPHPQMFEQQQNQIFKLMKLDSYSRFMKSSLYRQCLRCQNEGLPLPLEPNAQKDSSNATHIESRHSFSLKHRRLFPRRSKKTQGSNDSLHRDSSDSETGFIEPSSNARPEDLATMHQVGVDAALICKLILWDGSSTVLYAEEGKASIRDALNALCERRSVPLSAVDIYYQNEDRALALDQDVSVLAGQEVRIERRTLFRLDLLPIGRSVGVKAKTTKSTEEVLKPVVSKYGLEFDQLQTRLSGEGEAVDVTQPIQILDGLRVCVDYISQENSQDTFDKRARKSKTKADIKAEENGSKLPSQSDTEELIDIMSVAQSRKLHDQRGLLSEMNLELPDFLKTQSNTPAKLSQVVGNNNNSNRMETRTKRLDITTSTGDANDFHLDMPLVSGGKLTPNPVGTGNAKARIQKLKNIGEARPLSNTTTPVKSKTFRQKKASLDTDVSNAAYDTDTSSAVDDDPSVITKWMQSVSCTPKYPYAPDFHNNFSSPSPENTSMMYGVKGYSYEYAVESFVAHDHIYSKKNERVNDE